jgi:SH3-like domain-containing protein
MGFTDIITGLSFISMHVGLARLDKGLRQSVDIPEEKLQAYVDLTARAAQVVTISDQIKQLDKKAKKLKKEKLNAEHAQLMVQIGQLRLQLEQYKVEQKRLELELEKERRQTQENQILRMFVDLYDQAQTFSQQKRWLDFLVICVAILRIYRQIYSDLDDANNRLKLTQLRGNLFEKLQEVLENEQSRNLIADEYAAALKNPYTLLKDGLNQMSEVDHNLVIVSDLQNISEGEAWDKGIEKINTCSTELSQAEEGLQHTVQRVDDFSGGVDIREFFFLVNNPGVVEIQSSFSDSWPKLMQDIAAKVGDNLTSINNNFQSLPQQLQDRIGLVSDALFTLDQLRGGYKLGDVASQLKKTLPLMEARYATFTADYSRLVAQSSNNDPSGQLNVFLELSILRVALKKEMHLFPFYVTAQRGLATSQFEEKVTEPFQAVTGAQKDELSSQFGHLFTLYQKYLKIEKDVSNFCESTKKTLFKAIKDDSTYSNLYSWIKENQDPQLLEKTEAEIAQLPVSLGVKVAGVISNSRSREIDRRKKLLDRYAQGFAKLSVVAKYPPAEFENIPELPGENYFEHVSPTRKLRLSKKWLIAIPVGGLLFFCICVFVAAALSPQNTTTKATETLPVVVAQVITPTNTLAPSATATVKPSETPVPLPTSTFTPAPVGQVSILSSSINLRNGPGTEYKVVGSAKKGDQLDVYGISTDQSWLMVDQDGQVWVAITLVKSELQLADLPVVTQRPTATPTQTTTSTPTNTPTATRTPLPSKTPLPTKTPPPAILIEQIYYNYQNMTGLQFQEYKKQIVGKPVRQIVTIGNVADDGKVQLSGDWSPLIFNVWDFCAVVTNVPKSVAIDLSGGRDVYLEATINGVVGDYSYYYNCKTALILNYKEIRPSN